MKPENVYTVIVTASDGSLTDTINVTINITDIDETPPNRAPVFVEGDSATRAVEQDAERGVNIGTPILATDADDDTLNYTLGGTDAATFDIDSTTSQLKTKVLLDVETKPFYTVIVTASDGSLTDTITVTINIADVDENNPPAFTEGDSTTRTIAENTVTGTYIGTAITATDADNDTLTYTLGGTDAASFDIDHTNGQLKINATLDYETQNTYTVTVTVSDGNRTDTINVTISVTDVNENRTPVFTEGETTTRSIAENTAAATNIGTVVVATDADNNTLTYTLGGTNATAFDIDSTVGQLKTKATLDYETKNTYSVTITVSDGSLTDTISVTINVTDIDETPPNRAPVFVEGDSATRAVEQDAERGVNIGSPILATDADDDTLNYTLGGTDAATFDIDSTIGQLKTKVLLDVETKPFYTVIVTVSDGSLTDTITVTINIADVNENNPPVFTEGDSTTRTIAENTAASTNIGTAITATDTDNDRLTYTLSGTDAASFDIDHTNGQLKTKVALDYETKNTYTVTVIVSDGSLTDIIVVTINVSNVNEAPVFTEGDSTTRTVAEKTLEGVEIGTAIGATDPDDDTLTYTLDGADADIFELDSTTGQLKTKKILDFETQFTYKVTLAVSDGKLSNTIDVTITVIDIDETIPNRAPTFTDGENTTRSVVENTAADLNIGTPVAATDADGNTLIYTLGGTDAASFAIEAATGQLKTKTSLDYETKDSYTVTVTVSDDNAGTDSITVTINITDVDESLPISTFTGVCDRTPQVRDAIVAAAGVNSCEEVTEEHLKQIRVLDMDRSSITSLKSGDFDGLSSMESLKLIANDLSSLPDGIFDELTALTELNLIANDLSSLPDGIFDENTALTTLKLNANDLSSLPDGIFDENTALTTLELIANDLSSLPDSIFDELTALTSLHLSDNDLSSLPDGIFDELTALTHLSLSSNDLTSLPDGIFDELTALKYLGLGDNDLRSLPDSIFDKLTALTHLPLSSNDLTSLPDGIFDETHSVDTSLPWWQRFEFFTGGYI